MAFHNLKLARFVFGHPPSGTPDFDTEALHSDPALRQARDRAAAGDWMSARQVIDDAGTDWELRATRIGVLARAAAENDGWVYAWLGAEPDNVAAVLVQSSMLSHRAGEARGSASAKDTTEEQFRDFHRLSREAAAAGQRARELAGPDDPIPWVEALGTMFGDQITRSTSFDTIYTEGRRRDPHNFDLHRTAIALRCEKWYGSHDLMFGTARQVAADAPEGAHAVLLPLYAHFEYAMRTFAWDSRSKQAMGACREFFRRPDVQQELDGWIAKWQAGPHSPGRLNHVRQWMALYYTLAGRRDQARDVFDEIGPHVGEPVTAWAWFWLGDRFGYLRAWWWAHGK
ncbi:hypothetical protein [Actinoplanes rectilineatus]|uniref:hypothetical protein n=1 Tax=Actinoplanes rectilineatus TaxID=113571 RepID=UPI0005F29D78|nr:hypothetical protein [Actinoplanes rectilineatus]